MTTSWTRTSTWMALLRPKYTPQGELGDTDLTVRRDEARHNARTR